MVIIDIRRARPEDFLPMAQTVHAAWKQAYRELISPLDMERFTDDNRRIELFRARYSEDWDCFVVYADGVVRGVCSAEKYEEKGFFDTAIIHQLYIHPDFQHIRLGRKLLSHTLRNLRGKGYKYAVLFVMEGNLPAIRFYEKFGFKADGFREKNEGMTAESYGLRYRIEL